MLESLSPDPATPRMVDDEGVLFWAGELSRLCSLLSSHGRSISTSSSSSSSTFTSSIASSTSRDEGSSSSASSCIISDDDGSDLVSEPETPVYLTGEEQQLCWEAVVSLLQLMAEVTSFEHEKALRTALQKEGIVSLVIGKLQETDKPIP